MAIKDILPSSGLGFTDMADTYGVARTADLGTMYKNGNINMFSLKKPQSGPGMFLANATGIDDDHSLVCPLWTDMNNTVPGPWSYRRPSGGEASPYRGGDSAGYYRLARPFVTSGKIGGITFEWSIQTAGNGAYGPIMTLTFTRPTHPNNLREHHVKQHGTHLSQWYWSVLLKGRSGASYLFVAGETELSSRVAYAKLGEGNGNRIEASLTAEMADDLNGGQAIFFLWLPNRDIGGMSNADLQGLLGTGKMIGVYAGRDPGTGDMWINPVPLAVTRRSGNVMMTGDLNVGYNSVGTTIHGYAAFPVKIGITGGDSSMVHSSNMDWNAIYTPEGINKYFSAYIQLVENQSLRSRSVTLTAYKAVYPSAALAPAIDKATITIMQAARPMEIIFKPTELVIEAITGTGDVFFDCPADGQWYVRAVTTPELGPTGGNQVPWVLKLLKLSSQEGVVNSPVEIPINSESYMTGPAYVRVVCDANSTGAERTAYIHLSHSGGYNTLKITQSNR
ncbi:MAG: hypothetical protein LIO68_04310 [Rikenellaceae bacterium]|nr:hypothetical protein [Rikenellaceae bacterium]